VFVFLGPPEEENVYMGTKLPQTLTLITPYCPLLSASEQSSRDTSLGDKISSQAV
jgi:hypothetical protein